MGGLSFGQDADGNWGYKVGGADTVIPFSSGAELLWDNSANFRAKYSFPAQTLFLDLSKYSHIIFVTYMDTNGEWREDILWHSIATSVYAKDGKDKRIIQAMQGEGYTRGLSAIASRQVNITDSGIVFGNGRYAYGSDAYLESAMACVPYQIYGVNLKNSICRV